MKLFTMRSVYVAVLVAGAFAARGPGPAALAQDRSPGDAANGKRVYLADGCFMCHGRAGQGGAMNYPAPTIAPLETPVESLSSLLRVAPNETPAYSTNALAAQGA